MLNAKGQGANFKLYTILTAVILVVLFTIQNTAVVEIDFLLWTFQISRSLMIFLLLAVGILIGWFAAGHYKKFNR